MCVCVIRANRAIRATRIHAFYLCANTPFCAILCDSTQICADKLTWKVFWGRCSWPLTLNEGSENNFVSLLNYSLLYLNYTNYITSSGTVVLHDELFRTWEEASLSQFYDVSLNLPGRWSKYIFGPVNIMELQRVWKFCFMCSDFAVDGKRAVSYAPATLSPGKKLPISIEYEAIWAWVGVGAWQRK